MLVKDEERHNDSTATTIDFPLKLVAILEERIRNKYTASIEQTLEVIMLDKCS